MERVYKIFLFINLFVSMTTLFPLYGQEKEGMVKYTPDFRFNDGIYLNFEQVKMNSPIPKAKLLTSVDYNDREFFKKILENDKIYFYDDMGVRQEVAKNYYLGLFTKRCIIYSGTGKFQQDNLCWQHLSFCC